MGETTDDFLQKLLKEREARLQLLERLLVAVRTVDKLRSISDGVYAVREREGHGWHGPQVTEYGNACAVITEVLKNG